MKPLQELVRPNVWDIVPYSSARDEYSGVDASVFLDANESPYHAPYNRYPDPLQLDLKRMIAELLCVPVSQIFLGNGSDEAIDLTFRVFCQPGVDNVVAINPTYGMYKVCADLNDIAYRSVSLDANFQFTAQSLLAAADEQTKVIFICSPNNPTGNLLDRAQIEQLLTSFQGIVALDEAYVDFADAPSFLADLQRYPNLLVYRTFSKAWGSAAIRLGMAFASVEIIALFNKIKYPYNVNQLTQEKGKELLQDQSSRDQWVKWIKEERKQLLLNLQNTACCVQLYPTDANFVLVKVTDATAIYSFLTSRGIIVRNRTTVALCGNCLRISVGTPLENQQLIAALNDYSTDK
ncbi:MAG: histidinol-phosphate transaminase [Bacteroidaceae bacterium]|nr:histidinol-phosphate transaminase [Bacteroidaceae bacterium]